MWKLEVAVLSDSCFSPPLPTWNSRAVPSLLPIKEIHLPHHDSSLHPTPARHSASTGGTTNTRWRTLMASSYPRTSIEDQTTAATLIRDIVYSLAVSRHGQFIFVWRIINSIESSVNIPTLNLVTERTSIMKQLIMEGLWDTALRNSFNNVLMVDLTNHSLCNVMLH